MKSNFLAVAILVAASSGVLIGQRGSSSVLTPMVGVWRVAETITTDGTRITTPQPSLYIFTPTHYSITSVNTVTPRTDIDTNAATTTDAQRVALWGPFTANAGTYEIRGTELTTRAIVAKDTLPMRAGAFLTRTMTMEGNAVWLQTKANTAGPVNGVRTKLVRVN